MMTSRLSDRLRCWTVEAAMSVTVVGVWATIFAAVMGVGVVVNAVSVNKQKHAKDESQNGPDSSHLSPA
jgi:hypothetical protein